MVSLSSMISLLKVVKTRPSVIRSHQNQSKNILKEYQTDRSIKRQSTAAEHPWMSQRIFIRQIEICNPKYFLEAVFKGSKILICNLRLRARHSICRSLFPNFPQFLQLS